MKIINGKKIADKILSELKKEIKDKKLKPRLDVILIGDNPASQLYVKIKERTGRRIGIKVEKHILSNRIKEKEILKLIDSLNDDYKIDGILIQLPLPQAFSTDNIIRRINVKKDVDGFLKETKFISPFILAIHEAIKETKEKLENKKIIALVNSNIFKNKLIKFFNRKNLKLKTALWPINDYSQLKDFDIIITALGQPEIIKGNMIKEKSILIDGGISKKSNKVVGDIERESVENKVKWISPVPGGIGPLTVAFLLRNVVLAHKL